MELLNHFEKCYAEINKMAKELCESKIEKGLYPRSVC